MMLTVSVMIVISMIEGGQGNADTQIVNGEDATPGQFPWQVSLFKFSKHSCGGSIIDRRHIISAAHCFDDDTLPVPHPRTVIAGAHDLTKAESYWQNRSICHVSRHPNHTNSVKKDLVVLTLSKPLVYNERVQPIRLAEKDSDQEGQVCTTSGWGAREYRQANVSNTLQYINTTIMNQQKCLDAMGILQESEICAHDPTGHRSACFGDSGGPLVCYDEKGPYLVGAVSWGKECGLNVPVTVYARVSKYHDFIFCRIKPKN